MEQFKDIRVLELASVLAGPATGQFFAELGADVIKVENHKLGGDVTRTWKTSNEKTDDRSAYFCSVNWGKRSIAVDLSHPDGRGIIETLALQSDIVIASYKPGDAAKFGVDYKSLSRLNSGLIYGEITGYGEMNPRVGYDAVLQAEAGFMSMNGTPGGASLKMPVALIDVLAAHQLKEGILLAMLEKTITGQGRHVSVSLLQTALASLVNQATNWLVAGAVPGKQGSSHPNIAPYGDIFKTKDGREVLLAIGNDHQFRVLSGIVARESLNDPRFGSNQLRVTHRAELNTIFQEAIGNWESDALLPLLHSRNIPAGLVQNVKQALSLPEAVPLMLQGPGLTGIKTFVASSSPPHNVPPPPHLGEHTAVVLRETLNMSSERIKSLLASHIIA